MTTFVNAASRGWHLMLKQSSTTEADKRHTEYFCIFISELRNCKPAFKFGSISFKGALAMILAKKIICFGNC